MKAKAAGSGGGKVRCTQYGSVGVGVEGVEAHANGVAWGGGKVGRAGEGREGRSAGMPGLGERAGVKAGVAAAVGGGKSKLGQQACLGSSRRWRCCAATMCSDGPLLLSPCLSSTGQEGRGEGLVAGQGGQSRLCVMFVLISS